MKLKRTAILAILFICIELAVGTAILSKPGAAQLNLADINDLSYFCIENWQHLAKSEPEITYASPYSYAVFDDRGRRLYASGKGLPATLDDGLKNRDTILTLSIKEQEIGRLLILNEDRRQFQEAKKHLFFLLVLASSIGAILFLGYIFYLKYTFFLPFEKLETFAKRVAEGNLELPLAMDKKNVFGAFTESFDLMREELKKAREKQREAEQSKKELVAKLSHDIKTPIASIKAVSEVMEVQAETEKEKQQLAVINAKANQVDALISDLFHAALEELQELHVAPKDVLSSVIPKMIQNADYQKLVQMGDVPQCLIAVDELRLQQVFDNIITNSYKYANTQIIVTAQITGKTFFVSFRDFGPGAMAEELPLLKNKYYRGKTAQGKHGAGLGLYISSYLMEQMDGSLVCQNKKKGFEVIISLTI